MGYYGYGEQDFIPCAVCGLRANDIHHIVYRSHFGKKEQDKCNDISNLIALCRSCHNLAHSEILSEETLRSKLIKIIKIK